jgi:hypothetical protein
VTYRDGLKVFTAPGHLVSTGSATPVTVTLTIYGGTTHDSCLQDGKDLAGLPWDDYQAAMKSLHCKVDDVRVQEPRSTTTRGEVDVNSGDRCEGGRKVAKANSGRIDETIVVPENMKDTDLRVYIMESPQSASLEANKGTLRPTPDGNVAFQVYVGGRTAVYQTPDGKWVNLFLNNATIYVDATAVGGPNATKVMKTGTGGMSPGTAQVLVPAFKAGRIRIAAVWSDSKGQIICGAGHVDVAGTYPTARVMSAGGKAIKAGTKITTEMGRTWEYVGGRGNGWVRVAAANKSTGHGKSLGRSALGDWFGKLGSWLGSLFSNKQPSVSNAIGSSQSSAVSLDTNLKAKLAHLNLGGTGEGNLAQAHLITNDGGSIVATGGGNIVASGGGNIISNDGASIVASGAGNLVFGFSPAAGIVATGGGNLIGNDGAGIVATGGGNIVSPNGGTIISTNGGGIVSPNGGTIISTNGGGLIAAAGSNIVASGGGNIVSPNGGT